jgi:hypothetical protein
LERHHLRVHDLVGVGDHVSRGVLRRVMRILFDAHMIIVIVTPTLQMIRDKFLPVAVEKADKTTTSTSSQWDDERDQEESR